MSKSEVYSWRLSPELKAELEAAARAEKKSLSSLIERVMRDWLGDQKSGSKKDDDEQERMRKALMACAGTVRGDGRSATNEVVRQVVGERLRVKHERSRSR